jgi:ABC-type multidrug transport system fused ATPase/permease subunit
MSASTPQKTPVLKRLLQYVRPYRQELPIAVGLVLLGAASQSIGPFLIGWSIDHLITRGNLRELLVMLAVLFLTYFLGAQAIRGQILRIGAIVQKILAQLRHDIFTKIQSLPLSFFDRSEAGDLQSRLLNDVNTVNQAFGQTIPQMLGNLLGIGGQTLAEQELGWNRGTIRKGMQELTRGAIEDQFHLRGRKRVEEKLPPLLDDIRAIVEPHTQAEPTLKSERLYTRISAAEVRRQRMAQKGYRDEELPSNEVIRQRLNEMNDCLRRVVKAKPQKRIPETDAIFEQVHQVNQHADEDEQTLRISIDAKATVKIGDYDRGGKNPSADAGK